MDNNQFSDLPFRPMNPKAYQEALKITAKHWADVVALRTRWSPADGNIYDVIERMDRAGAVAIRMLAIEVVR